MPRAQHAAAHSQSNRIIKSTHTREGEKESEREWIEMHRRRRHYRLPSHRAPPLLQGGQNVNKLNTKAQLRLAVAAADWLDAHTKRRLAELYPHAMTREGDLLVTSQRHRTQEANLDDAFAKLRVMVLAAAQVPAVRELKVDLTAHAKAARTSEKRHRGDIKARRRSGSGGGDD